jgi:hypothetical protein
MTKRFRAAAVGLCALGAVTACSTSEPTRPPADDGVFGQIELTALTGDYAYDGPDSSRSTSFPFPDDIATFRELRLAVSGTWSVGTMEITDRFGFTDTVAFHVRLIVRLATAGASVDYFEAFGTPRQGETGFFLDDTFFACCPQSVLDPELLLEAEISARMSVAYTLPANARVLTAPQGNITEVTVEAVDAARAEWPPGRLFP